MVKVRRPEDEAPTERGDGTYVYMRAEDRSMFMKIAYWKDKYSIIWIPLVGLAVSLGYGFRTPVQVQHEMRAHVDSATLHLQTEIDEIRHAAIQSDSQWKIQSEGLAVILRLQCINPTIKERDQRLAGLDCVKVLSGSR